ncbi:MAG: hypothetical protein ACLTML_09580 [Blautia faecis]
MQQTYPIQTGDDCTATWTTEPTGCVYSGKDETIYNWTQDSAEGSFTIPEDAASGDCFCLDTAGSWIMQKMQ